MKTLKKEEEEEEKKNPVCMEMKAIIKYFCIYLIKIQFFFLN